MSPFSMVGPAFSASPSPIPEDAPRSAILTTLGPAPCSRVQKVGLDHAEGAQSTANARGISETRFFFIGRHSRKNIQPPALARFLASSNRRASLPARFIVKKELK